MDSLPTSEWRFYSWKGDPLPCPVEWESGWIEPPATPADLEWLSLRVQGAERDLQVRKVSGAFRLVAEWPRSGPGHYRLELHGGEPSELVVTVLPRKLTTSSYETLIEDLRARLPASIAVGLQKAGALAGVDLRPPSEVTLGQEISRLREAIRGKPSAPGLIRVLAQLAQRPHEVLSARTEWKARRLARRPHPTSLVRALVAAGNMRDGLPERVPDRLVEPTVDVYENRLVRLFLQQVEVRLRAVRRAAERCKLQGLVTEADSLITSLTRAVRQAAFLERVTLVRTLPLEPTMVLMRRPAYRAAFEAYLEFQKSPWVTIRLDQPLLRAPLRNLPALYQAWGGLVVIEVILQLAVELGYVVEHEQLTRRGPNDLWVQLLPQGSPVLKLRHPEGPSVALSLEPVYSKSGKGLRSLSFQQKPDVAVVVAREGKEQLYLFDPKYKLEGEIEGEKKVRPKKVDIDKMHAYRDAIRGAKGARVVAYAGVLYPGDYASFGGEIEALPAVPGDARVFERHLRRVLDPALRTSFEATQAVDRSD